MQRLTGQDAGFLYNETPAQHMHTLKIAVLDPSTIPGGYSFEKVKEVLGSHPGTTEVQLKLVNGSRETVLRLDQGLRVRPSTALMGDIKALLGPTSVALL